MINTIRNMQSDTILIPRDAAPLSLVMRVVNELAVEQNVQFYVHRFSDVTEIKKCTQPSSEAEAKEMQAAHRYCRRSVCRFLDKAEWDKRVKKKTLTGENRASDGRRKGSRNGYDFSRLLRDTDELRFGGDLQKVRCAATAWAKHNNAPVIMKTFGNVLCVRLSPYKLDYEN